MYKVQDVQLVTDSGLCSSPALTLTSLLALQRACKTAPTIPCPALSLAQCLLGRTVCFGAEMAGSLHRGHMYSSQTSMSEVSAQRPLKTLQCSSLSAHSLQVPVSSGMESCVLIHNRASCPPLKLNNVHLLSQGEPAVLQTTPG